MPKPPQTSGEPGSGDRRHSRLVLRTQAVFVCPPHTFCPACLQWQLGVLIDVSNRLCRTIGTIFGMGVCNAILWHYWPEAHGYFVNPLGMFINGTSLLCDLVYPFALWQVRKTEVTLPDGRLVSREKFGHMQTVGKKGL